MRHPIIERINSSSEYVPNDVMIGLEEVSGMLLYGCNAVGKSSLMKAIGLNIILAQAGFFVAAKTFTYHPYKKIFTRISGNDNIFKGHSSFAVEILELNNIYANDILLPIIEKNNVMNFFPWKKNDLLFFWFGFKYCCIITISFFKLTSLMSFNTLYQCLIYCKFHQIAYSK